MNARFIFRSLLLLHLFSICCSLTRSERGDSGLHALLEWARSKGADVAKLRPGNDSRVEAEEVRAFYTSVPIRKEEMVMFIPSKLLITDEVARRSSIIQKYAHLAFQTGESVNADVYVSMFVFLENVVPGQREASQYAAYYNSLPPYEFDFNIPILFWKQDPNNLLGRQAFDILLQPRLLNLKYMASEMRFHGFVRRMKEPGGLFRILAADTRLPMSRISLIFKWAVAIVMTRSWSNPHPSMNSRCTLVPIMDMLNHNDNASGLVPVAVEGNPEVIIGVGMVAPNDLQKNARIFDSYDPPGIPGKEKEPMCIDTMLFTYGFLPDEALTSRPYCISFEFQIDFQKSRGHLRYASYPAMEKSISENVPEDIFMGSEWDQALRLNQKTYKLKLHYDQGDYSVPPSLFAILRFSEADKKALDVARRREDGFARPLSADNERRMLKKLHSIFSTVLSQIPSSEEEDRISMKRWQYYELEIKKETKISPKGSKLMSRIRDVNVRNYQRMMQALSVRIQRRKILSKVQAFIKEQRSRWGDHTA